MLLEQVYNDDNVDFVVGIILLVVVFVMFFVVEENGKVLIVELAVVDVIIGEKWNCFIFCMVCNLMQDVYGVVVVVLVSGEVLIVIFVQDYVFGKDGVVVLKIVFVEIWLNVKVVFEEYVLQNVIDFIVFVQCIFDVLKDKLGKKIINIIWVGQYLLLKIVDLKFECFGIEIVFGGNILLVMQIYKNYFGMEGVVYYYYVFLKNVMNDWFVVEYQKCFNVLLDFFIVGGFVVVFVVVMVIQKVGGIDIEKLIMVMEGMIFEMLKGLMIFCKEDYQVLQEMYYFKVKVNGKDVNDLFDFVVIILADKMFVLVWNKC